MHAPRENVCQYLLNREPRAEVNKTQAEMSNWQDSPLPLND